MDPTFIASRAGTNKCSIQLCDAGQHKFNFKTIRWLLGNGIAFKVNGLNGNVRELSGDACEGIQLIVTRL